MKLSENAKQLLNARYLLKNTEGKIVESPEELFWRVAKYVASVEKEDRKKWENKFYHHLEEYSHDSSEWGRNRL